MTTPRPEKLTPKLFKALLLITAISGLTPLLLYGWANYAGALPSQQQWDARQGNHGPWWGTINEPIILLCLLLLIGLSVCSPVAGAGSSLRLKRIAPLAWGLGVATLQLLFAYGLITQVFWTID